METEDLRLRHLGTLTAELFHEIKNPLTIIASRTELIRCRENKKPQPDLDLLNGLKQIHDQSIRMNKMVERVQSIARGQEIDPKKPERLHLIINDAIDQCLDLLNSNNVAIEVDGTDEYTVASREFQLSQVFINLIRNSVQAIQHEPNRWIKIMYSRSPVQTDYVTIRVQDSGSGIHDPKISSIENNFISSKSPKESMGMGLQISKAIIADHGGQLHYVGTGTNTEFRILLPLSNNFVQHSPG